MINIAIIQFPGSNTERETIMACRRVGMNPIEFLWNEPAESLSDLDGFVIVGGFSYEDRSRAGIIAALDPIMKQIQIESKKGKPVLGICNGAQILVESGLVPGLKNNQRGVALTDNKRIKGDHVLGVGYYNTWANLRQSAPTSRSAFTRHLKQNDLINIPLAHAEGRFMIPELLLKKMIENEQVLFQYCKDSGEVVDEFPFNPNGSIYNIAAICNADGNVMAMMPHPERTNNGDPIFSSMKEHIELGAPMPNFSLDLELNINSDIVKYSPSEKASQLIINLIITDNEEISVRNALKNLGFDVSIKRQKHWEIEIDEESATILNDINKSGELFNSNKEHIGEIEKADDSISILVRKKDDIHGRIKLETLKNKFGTEGIKKITSGVIWNLSSNKGNIRSEINEILNTNILHNPLSHECYKIN